MADKEIVFRTAEEDKDRIIRSGGRKDISVRQLENFKAYQKKWTHEHQQQYYFRLYPKTEQDVISELASHDNVKEYIASLIARDIRENGGTGNG